MTDIESSPVSLSISHIGDRFALPPGVAVENRAYQYVSWEQWKVMNLAGTTWKPVNWNKAWKDHPAKITREGWVEVDDLLLVEQTAENAKLSAEDERVKPLVIQAISERGLTLNEAFVDRNTVRRAFEEAKQAYDDTAFRNSHRDAIIERAKRLARRAGQTPELLVSTEAPVPCRLEGMQLYFFNEQRLLPVWRFFEPLAIVQLKEELQVPGIYPSKQGEREKGTRFE